MLRHDVIFHHLEELLKLKVIMDVILHHFHEKVNGKVKAEIIPFTWYKPTYGQVYPTQWNSDIPAERAFGSQENVDSAN